MTPSGVQPVTASRPLVKRMACAAGVGCEVAHAAPAQPLWSDEEILDTAERMAELRLLDEEIG